MTKGLTVGELIEKLQQVQDKTKIVRMEGRDCYTTAGDVEEKVTMYGVPIIAITNTEDN